jgi:AraC-like DNA-binding protein
MHQAILGRPASELAGRIVALRDLWDPEATERLEGRLAAATDARSAAALLSAALAERLEVQPSSDANVRLAQTAARRLASQSVTSVAKDLGVSERHLRRIFHEVVGLSPKTFFKLRRFERALAAAKEGGASTWSDIAAEAGYYDQAHLIKEFRSIAGATPREFLEEVNGHSALIELD